MHPLLDKTRLRGYLSLWGLLGALLGALLSIGASVSPWDALALALPLSLVYAFVCLAAWYPVRSLPLKEGSVLRVAAVHVAGSFLSSGLIVLVGHGWSRALELLPGVVSGELYRSSVPAVVAVAVLAYLISVSAHYVILAFEEARSAERRALSLAVLAREAELRALKTQIHPHFLFNSLNSISALTSSDAEAARRMCLRLADFMRLSLARAGEATLTIGDELALVELFLAIEQVRLGPRLSVSVDVDAAARACLVPPLLLQPLVENAVTHGIGSRLEGGLLRVEGRRRGARVELAVENPRDTGGAPPRGLGIGLENVKGRLQARYGSEARMDVVQTLEAFRVALSFPAATA